MKTSSKLSYSNLASTLALAIAVSGVGGVAYAAGVAANSVGSPQIKDGQVKTADLGKNAVTGPKVKNGSLAQGDLNGAAKAAFTAGADAYFDDLNFHNITSGDPDKTIFAFTVPAGDYLVSASANITNSGGDVNDFTCELVQPVGNEFTRTIATSEVRVANGGGNLGTVALDGVAIDIDVPMELSMTCQGQQAPYSGQVLDPRIVAVELGDAIEK